MHGSYIYKKINILKISGYKVEQTNKHKKNNNWKMKANKPLKMMRLNNNLTIIE